MIHKELCHETGMYKKLLDFLCVKEEKAIADPGTDPLFSWTANLLLLNRRKTIVITHTASHATFLLYGLTAKNLKNIQCFIIEGMETLLKSMYVRKEIIDQYLNDCGRSTAFSPNSSRSVISVCNKVCERVSTLTYLLDPDDLFQKPFLLWLNDDIAEILEILSQPKHPEYKDLQAWVRSSFWHPLDSDHLSARIRHYNPMPIPVQYD